MNDLGSLVSAVVVDYHAGSVLGGCLDSLVANGVTDLVVVENGEVGSTLPALGGRAVTIVTPQMNLGYGRGVNRGAAATKATPFLLVSNPDVVVHDGAVAEMLRVLESTPQAAVASGGVAAPGAPGAPPPGCRPTRCSWCRTRTAPWSPSCSPATTRSTSW